MLTPGLVSISFRSLSPQEICDLCVRSGLKAVEWGGDVHVPAGDIQTAEQVRRLSADSGLKIAAYGSYYRAGQPESDFDSVLKTALVLGAPQIRIWAGTLASKDCSQAQRQAVVSSILACAHKAAAKNLKIVLEYHGNTLTDDRESVRLLLSETLSAGDSLRFYWQPRWDWSESERLASLEDLGDRLSSLHVFTWQHHARQIDRLALQAGEGMWQQVLHHPMVLKNAPYALLEFVTNDNPELLLRDAATLNRWLNAQG